MAKSVKSARGVEVNFDLIKIKQQIASAPKTTDVKVRENFVDQKLKRRLKRASRSVSEQLAEIKVDPKLPSEEPPTDL